MWFSLLRILLLISIAVNISIPIYSQKQKYTAYDFLERLTGLESVYGNSQYVSRNPSAWIPDETINTYAGYKYVTGVSPVLIASDTPPLGRYLIGLSALWFGNEHIIILISFALFIWLFYQTAKSVLNSNLWAITVVALLCLEPILKNQLIYTPLLDIMQCWQLLGALYFFTKYYKDPGKKPGNLLISGIFTGIFMSTKFFMSGFTIIAAEFFLILAIRQYKLIPALILNAFLSIGILLTSYVRLLFDGYSIPGLLGVQKWVYLYHQSQIIYPFSVWPLIFLNRWYVWFGNNRVISDPQWFFMWPVVTIISLITLILYLRKKIPRSPQIEPYFVWSGIYLIFLSIGQTTSRYLLILLPVLYLIMIFGIQSCLRKIAIHKKFMITLKKYGILIIFTVMSMGLIPQVRAEYILPYPSFMPGNKLYRFSRIYDGLMRYWYFGNLAGIKYHLGLSDKYLVEAKTLFEYKQYLLAFDAQIRSDAEVQQVMPFVKSAVKKNIDVRSVCGQLSEAMIKHEQILTEIKNITPVQFLWQPEKTAATDLKIHEKLDQAISQRTLLLSETQVCQ